MPAVLTRREVVAAGGAGIALLNLSPWPGAARAAAPAPAAMSLFLSDRTCGGALASVIASHDVPVATYAGDIGSAWMDHLAPLWRESPEAVGGVSFGGAFFCLERLARDRGLVCTFRACPPLDVDGLIERCAVSTFAGALLHAAGRSGPGTTAAAAGEAADRPLAWVLRPADASAVISAAGMARKAG